MLEQLPTQSYGDLRQEDSERLPYFTLSETTTKHATMWKVRATSLPRYILGYCALTALGGMPAYWLVRQKSVIHVRQYHCLVLGQLRGPARLGIPESLQNTWSKTYLLLKLAANQ